PGRSRRRADRRRVRGHRLSRATGRCAVRLMRRHSTVHALAALFALAACATTGATLGSGVGDRFLEHPPFYAGASLAVLDRAAPLGNLPVAYQRGASQAPVFDPSLSVAMQQLLADMTAYLDSLGVGPRLVEGGRVSAVAH